VINNDSYIAMEHRICPVCTKKHNYDCSILIHKRLKHIEAAETISGWGLCQEHAEQEAQGYIFLVGIDESQSGKPLNLSTMHRTGQIAAIKSEAYKKIFNADLPKQGIACVGPKVIEELKNLI